MSDLKYTVEVTGLKDVEQLEKNLDRLHKTLNAGQGSGKSLEEMRKILVGMRGQASIISDLRDSIKGLNTAADQLSKSFDSGFKQLDRTFKQGFQLVLDRVNMFGAEYGSALGTQLTKGMESAGQAAKASGEKLAGELKNIRKKLADSSTAAYEGLVSGNPLQKLNANTAKELVELQAHGARLSSFHKTVVDEYKKYGTLYTQEMSAFEAEKQRARDKELKVERAFSAELSKILADRQAARRKELEDAARASVRTAINAPSGTYQVYNPTTGLGGQIREVSELSRVQEKAAKTSGSLSNALRILTVDGNDTHSAMRGLASGFNLLWLTWGNLAPLFAGAAISNGFVQTAKTGMEVAHTLAIIENIGGNTKDEVAALNQELLRLGKTGPFGPQEVAEAMKTLSLAGLKATEILSATQSTLNFAIAGTTNIQTAADTLVSVTTAFGMGAQGFERVGDVISKAAAESKTSVESFANAMKTASVIGAQYGVSLEDTATAIATMSQLGIEGTAAGTALRNMYADLSGRSAQVAKVLKAQGIEMRDLTTGGFKPMVQVVAELSDHFDGLTAIGQKNLMQALLSERGAKGLVEMLRLIKVEAKDTSKGFANALEEMRKNIEESYGFTAVNAAKLSQTTKSLFEQMGATLKTSMYEAFTEIEPTLSTIARELKLAFGSEDFKDSLTTLVKGVAEVGRSLVQVGVFAAENIGTVAMLAAGYKAFTVAANLSAAAQLALTAATKADTAANVANAASQASKLAGIAAFARFLPGIGTAITVAAGAWALYDAYQRDSSKSSLEFARNYTSDVVKALNDETSRLKELNRLRREGLTLTEAQARLDALDKKTQYVDPYAQAVNSAIKAELAARAELAKREEEYAKYSAKDNKHRVEEQERVVRRLAQQTRAAKAEELAAINQINKATEDAIAARKEAANLDAIDFENRKKLAQVFGKNTFELGAGGGGAGGNGFVDLNRDKELQALRAHYDAELAVANDYYNKSKQLLDSHRSANLISEEEYMVQSLQLTRSHEAEQLQVLEASLAAYTEASERRRAALESQLSGANGKGRSTLLDQLKKETQEFEIFVTDYEKQRAKVAAESYARVGEIVLKLQTEVGKLLKSSDDFWDNAAVSFAAQKEADELARKYKNMNTSILSMDSAMYEFEKAQKSTQSEVKKLNAALEKQLAIQKNLLQIELLSLQAAQASGRLTMDELIQRVTLISQLKEGVAELEDKISSNTEKGLELGAERGWEAFQKMREKQVEELANSLSEAVVDGLMSGDYKSIGKNIRDILQKELIRKPLTAIINGVMGSIVGGISNALFGGGSAAGAAGQLGQIGNLSSLFSGNSGLTLGTSAGNWLFDTGFSMASGANLGTISNSLGNSMMSLGNTITQWDSALQAIPGLEGGFGSVFGYGSALVSLSQGNYGSAIGAALGTWLGAGNPIGTWLGSTLGSLVDGMFGGGTDDYGAAARYSGGKLSDSGKAYTYAELTQSYAEGLQKPMDSLALAIGSSLDGLATMFGGKAGYSVQMGYTSDDDDPSRGIFIVQNPEGVDLNKWLHYRSGEYGNRKTGYRFDKNPEKGFDDYLKAITADTIPLIMGVVPAWADAMLEGFGKSIGLQDVSQGGKGQAWKNIANGQEAFDKLQALLQEIAQVEAAFTSLGQTMSMFSGISDEMKTTLLSTFGGIQGVSEAASSYYQNFYSEEERFRKAGESVNTALRAIGVQLDVFGGEAAKIQYRNLVEKAFADGNQELAAQLLQLSAAFAEVADAADQASAAVKDAAKKLVDNAWANFEAAVNRVTDSLKEQISTLSEAVDAHKKLGETLKNAVKELRNEVASTSEWSAARGMIYIEDALSKVRSGSDTLDFKDLEEAIAAARSGISKGAYVSQFERDRDALVLAGQLEELGELNGEQLSTEEKQLRILKEQLEYYEAYLASARDMVNGVNTLIDKTLSPEQAYALLLKSMSEAQGVGKGDLAYDDYIRRKADALTDPAAAAKQQLIKDVAKSFEGSNDPIGLWKAITAAGGNEYDLNALYGWAIEDLKALIKYMGDAAYEDYLKRKVGAENDPTIAAMQQAIKDAAKPYEGTGDVKGLWEAIKKAGGNEFDLSALYGWAVEDIRKVIKDLESAKSPPPSQGGGHVAGPGSSSYSDSAQADYERRRLLAIQGGDAAKTQRDIREAAKQYEGTGDVAGLWSAVKSAGGNEYDLANLYGWDVNDIRGVVGNLPSYDVGTNYVPRDMLAQIHEGEAIIPKRYNPFNPGHASALGGVNNELVSELRSLHETIHELKAEVAHLKDAAARTAKNTEGVPQLVDQFDEVTEGGNVLRTEVV